MEYRGNFCSKERRFLSNMFKAKMTINNIEFHSVEQYYMFMKSDDLNYQEQILNEKDPQKCKTLSRKLLKKNGYQKKEWEKIKVDIMDEAVFEKFTQNPELLERLKNVPDEELVETNNWGDTFWGVDIDTGVGEDKLGESLRLTKMFLGDLLA